MKLHVDCNCSTFDVNVLLSYILYMYMLQLGYCGDSVTIVIISVTIMTVIAKAYCRDSGHVVTGMCI